MAVATLAPLNLADRLAAHLPSDFVAELIDAFETQGFCVSPELVDSATLARQREALAPWMEHGPKDRNVFEGRRTHRVYEVLAEDPVFAELVAHPVALAWAEHYLEESCLLSACLAICLESGESVQPWHTDDGQAAPAPPHALLGMPTFWALDDTNLENDATEVLLGSHLWSVTEFPGVLRDLDFAQGDDLEGEPGAHPDVVSVTMRAGSIIIARGDLWQRVGSNRSGLALRFVTPQYCAGWLRPLESMLLSVSPEQAALLPERVRELSGCSIHPPFMGYSDDVHPRRLLP